jgi:hypothetical protein
MGDWGAGPWWAPRNVLFVNLQESGLSVQSKAKRHFDLPVFAKDEDRYVFVFVEDSRRTD